MTRSPNEPKPPAEEFGELLRTDRRVQVIVFGGMLVLFSLLAAKLYTESGTPTTTDVTRVSPENQVQVVSIFVPLVLIAVIELASIGRDVSPDIVKRTRWNRLTIVHWLSGFLLMAAFDLTKLWGEFAALHVGMIIQMLWIALPMIEVGFYDQVFDRGNGIADVFSSSLMVHVVFVFLITTYIEEIVRMGFPPIGASPYLSLAEGLFRFLFWVGGVYVFVWFLEREAAIAEHRDVEGQT